MISFAMFHVDVAWPFTLDHSTKNDKNIFKIQNGPTFFMFILFRPRLLCADLLMCSKAKHFSLKMTILSFSQALFWKITDLNDLYSS
jgi:hypothetical protein